jgi:hypothetical protein
MGRPCCAALQIDWTEYWNDPSPMTAITGRLRGWSGDGPVRVQVGQVRWGLLDQDGVRRPDFVEGAEDLGGGQRPVARRRCGARRVGRHPVPQFFSRPVGLWGVLAQEPGEGGEGQHGVAQQAVAHRSARRLGRVVGDVQEPGPARQVGTGHVGVVAEHGGAYHQGHVVTFQLLGQRPDGEGQPAQSAAGVLYESVN